MSDSPSENGINDPKVAEDVSGADDWETDAEPVNKEAILKAEVEAQNLASIKAVVEEKPEDANKTVTEAQAPSVESPEEQEATFRPKLISSEKIRNKASSTGYGTKVIGKKPPKKAIDEPTFKPNLNVGKITEKKRAKSAGSQYGRFVPKKKPPKVEEISFTPALVQEGKAKEMREKARSKIYAAAEKKAAEGKQLREEFIQNKKESVARYTLAADHDTPVTALSDQSPAKPPMILGGVSPEPTKDMPSPPKRSKVGEKLLKKAVSHYDTSSYTPTKTPKPSFQEQPKWQLAKLPASENGELPAVAIKKLTNVVSKYGKDYAPPKSARPVTPKAASPPNFTFTTSAAQSPLDISPDELPKPNTKKKFKEVKSSGYGVVSPVPSVPAKVESYKHRSKANLLNTKTSRDDAANDGNESDSGKENPSIQTVVKTGPVVDDLLSRAAKLDTKATPLKPPVLHEGNGASPVSENASQNESVELPNEAVEVVPAPEGAQLTML